jgi:hypothetical protein
MIANDVPIPALRMQPQERQDWIVAYIMAHSYSNTADEFRSYYVDCLHADFIDAYCEATNTEPHYMILGANKCPQAARDLRTLHELGLLHRHRTGVQSPTSGGGWPKWVWSYSIAKGMDNTCRMVADSFKARFPDVSVY